MPKLFIRSFAVTAFIAGLVLGLGRSQPVACGQATSIDGRALTPAGRLVIDATTGQPAVGALPVGFARSPDHSGPDGSGRYLVAINSGFGVAFNAETKPEQSLSLIDLDLPSPEVIQNVYFPSPQSAQVGMAFDPNPLPDGSFRLYVSGGVENKIWLFGLSPGAAAPLQPSSDGLRAHVTADSIDVSGFAPRAPSRSYNDGMAPVYPLGIAVSADGRLVAVANNLADSLGLVADPDADRRLTRVDLHRPGNANNIYPYGVAIVRNESGAARKAYVSCWSSQSVAVVDLMDVARAPNLIQVQGHPTALLLNRDSSRLYVANSASDSVSIVDTRIDKVIETINIKLAEKSLPGNTPEALAQSDDGRLLFVADAHSNSVAEIELSDVSRKGGPEIASKSLLDGSSDNAYSHVRGFIPTGSYPSALAVIGKTLFIGNGKGTGFENSSMVVSNSGLAPNAPNDRFPSLQRQGGEYIVSLLSGNISAVDLPDDQGLAAYTAQVLVNNGLVDRAPAPLFKNGSPIKHVIYIIKENRTYDQLFGDLKASGDGKPADGDARLAIFGDAEAAAHLPGNVQQRITPNHHALALRFGLLDRFFVNSEASADGHNWSTAAFSSDYVDKTFRWNYSGRGRTYDFEGFNRLPDYEPPAELPPAFRAGTDASALAGYMREFVPYLKGGRDVAEPETLYLWDAAARAGITYRNYGEFVATISQADVDAINRKHAKAYPDTTPTVACVATKKALEDHFCPSTRSFDLHTPDIMTAESYSAARSSEIVDPAVTGSAASHLRGTSRFGAWQSEFRSWAEKRKATGVDEMPDLIIMRLPNDHTSGMQPGLPTPQFHVADNDYALGRLVQEVSGSIYWKDTAVFVVEDDAQAGPDHVDAHRSPALIVSAYNRPGALIHSYYTTVSLIRTIELLLGIPAMNQMDANARPIDIFQDKPNLDPFKAVLPEVALDNLIAPARGGRAAARLIDLSRVLDISHADAANPAIMNLIIWRSVRREAIPVGEAHLAAADAMRLGVGPNQNSGDEFGRHSIARLKEISDE